MPPVGSQELGFLIAKFKINKRRLSRSGVCQVLWFRRWLERQFVLWGAMVLRCLPIWSHSTLVLMQARWRWKMLVYKWGLVALNPFRKAKYRWQGYVVTIGWVYTIYCTWYILTTQKTRPTKPTLIYLWCSMNCLCTRSLSLFAFMMIRLSLVSDGVIQGCHFVRNIWLLDHVVIKIGLGKLT